MNQVFNRVKFDNPNDMILSHDIAVPVGSADEVPYHDTSDDELDRLIERMKEHNWYDVIAEVYADSNPWLCKIVTNSNRSDFLFLLPIRREFLALDLGAGWGQVAVPLSKFCDVVAVEGNIRKLRIIKEIARQERSDNIMLCKSDILKLPFEKKQFNLIILNGVLEWVGSFQSLVDPIAAQQQVLENINNLLVPGGYLYIGIENKYGLKYLLGEIDDHTGLPDFTYLPEERAKQVFRDKFGKDLRVFVHSKNSYETMLKNAGFNQIQFFGALPDYKLPHSMVDLSRPEISKYFLEVMDYVDEHKGGENGGLSRYNEKMSVLYGALSLMNSAELFYPSYGIISQK